MPVSKEQQQEFPGGSIRSDRWQRIRNRVLSNAQWRCEKCGLKDRSWVVKMYDGSWSYSSVCEGNMSGLQALDWIQEVDGKCLVKVILVVAHRDHNPRNNDLVNLVGWCQRCHNRFDAKRRGRNRRERVRARKVIRGLFE